MERAVVKIELGGGTNPRGDGFRNLDFCESADIQHDLVSLPWPLESDSVDELYSSHCLEHLADIRAAIVEIARVCRIGGRIEIRLPHWLHDCAMGGLALGYQAHLHSYGPQFWWRFCNEAGCRRYWHGSAKRLFLTGTHYQPENTFDEAKTLFPQMADEQIMRLIPGTCHEVHYFFEIIAAHDPRSTERAIST